MRQREPPDLSDENGLSRPLQYYRQGHRRAIEVVGADRFPRVQVQSTLLEAGFSEADERGGCERLLFFEKTNNVLLITIVTGWGPIPCFQLYCYTNSFECIFETPCDPPTGDWSPIRCRNASISSPRNKITCPSLLLKPSN